MSSSPTPSQLPNATVTTRGAVPRLNIGWKKSGNLITYRGSRNASFPIELSDHRWLFVGGNNSDTCEIMAADGKTSIATGSSIITHVEGYAGARVGTKVLVVGGREPFTGPIASAEVFDESTGLWTAAPDYPGVTNLQQHQAIALNNGKILVAGGAENNGGTPLATAYLFNPALNTWAPAADMTYPRTQGLRPVRISATKTLWAGGFVWSGGSNLMADIYDETANTWTLAALSTRPCTSDGTVTLMANGKVLKAGGSWFFNLDGEVYDPVANTWTLTGPMKFNRYNHQAVAFQDGRVLVFGGYALGINLGKDVPAEIYDPTLNTWEVFGVGPSISTQGSFEVSASGRLFGRQNVDGIFIVPAFTDLIEVLGANDPVMGALSAFDGAAVASSVTLPLGRLADGILLRGLSLDQPSNPYVFGRVEPYIGLGGTSVSFRQVDVVKNSQLAKTQNLIQNGGLDFWTRNLAVATVVHTSGLSDPTWARSGCDRWTMGVVDNNISASNTTATFERVPQQVSIGHNDKQQVTPFSGKMTWTALPYPPPAVTTLSGTLDFTNGSPVVTGSGTSFTSETLNGWFIANNNNFYWAQIASVDSDTQITLVNPYTGPDDFGTTAQTSVLLTAQGSWTITQEIDRDLVMQARGKVMRPNFRAYVTGPGSPASMNLRLRIYTSDDPGDIGQNYRNWFALQSVYDQTQGGIDFQLGSQAYWQKNNVFPTVTDQIGDSVVAMAVQLDVSYDTTSNTVGDSIELTQFSLKDDAGYYPNVPQEHPDFQYSTGSRSSEELAMKKYIEASWRDPDTLTLPPVFKNCISNVPENHYIPFGTVPKWQGSGTPVLSVYSPNSGAIDNAFDPTFFSDVQVTLDADGKLTGTFGPLTNPVLVHYLIDAEFPI